MAPYGEPRYTDKVEKLIHVAGDGSFSLDMDYFTFHHSAERSYSGKFVELFGPPRDSRLHFFTPQSGYPSYFGARPSNFEELARLNQHYADVAASVQRVTEETILGMARALHAETGKTRLCMAGGVALNSVANGRILRETPFEEIYIQPSAGDGGGALGAALYAYHCLLGKPRQFVMEHAAWGAEYSASECRTFLESRGVAFEEMADEDRLIDRVVHALQEGQVIGWFQGRFEWGPRALGQRSILADPRRADMKDVVNTKIKFREPYRPFAPSVTAAAARQFFDLDGSADQYPHRFMLDVVDVKPEMAARLPATTHVDGTARVQIVHAGATPRYHALIERFGEATGVPVLLNTSFNLKGEPIVASPADAWRSFARCDMDMLVLGEFIVDKDRAGRRRA